ncbi:uncharacterized protein LOC125039999 [Penaeus chinensis]|uniref:uncharacterized protein LOC125039999 n=1 Tax=Penaeus chinensis TaxID=139456 RepID=UPI001FB67FB9|nr:uncharacterized protein LOC125039999 [Penaeus chinensis]
MLSVFARARSTTNPTTVFSRSDLRLSPSCTFRSSPTPSKASFTSVHAPRTPTPATMSSSSTTSSSATVSSALVLGLLCLAGLASARMPYVFSSGSEFITGQVAQTFSCEGLPYGYYADVDNACRVFHICLPIPDDLGQIVETAHFSFICGNQTIFDQQTLTCNHPQDAFPCDQAPSLYDIKNAEFGRIENDNF